MTRGHDFLILSGSESDGSSNKKKCRNCDLFRWEEHMQTCSECNESYHDTCVDRVNARIAPRAKGWICHKCIHCDGCGKKQVDLGITDCLQVPMTPDLPYRNLGLTKSLTASLRRCEH